MLKQKIVEEFSTIPKLDTFTTNFAFVIRRLAYSGPHRAAVFIITFGPTNPLVESEENWVKRWRIIMNKDCRRTAAALIGI